MIDYEIREVTTSYREVIVPNKDNSDTSSTIECYLVVHCLYTYDQVESSVEYDAYKIATKKYDTDGSILSVEEGTGNIPTYEEIEPKLKELIEENITSDIREEIYRSLIRSAVGVAENQINKYPGYNKPYYK